MNVTIDIRSNNMAFESDFRRLNEEWIKANFWLEETDVLMLNNPQNYILDKGGNVFFALLDNNPVGTCALIVIDAQTCELAKMVVDPKYSGQGIGFMLGEAFINRARERGFSRIILEGNTKMEASIALYRKLGFHEIPMELDIRNSIAYKRCNIVMELILNPSNLPEYFI